MALICRNCGSDLTQNLADRAKCLQCGNFFDPITGEERPEGLVWTSEVPDQTAITADRTKAAS